VEGGGGGGGCGGGGCRTSWLELGVGGSESTIALGPFGAFCLFLKWELKIKE
jgi:hypothetical protein